MQGVARWDERPGREKLRTVCSSWAKGRRACQCPYLQLSTSVCHMLHIICSNLPPRGGGLTLEVVLHGRTAEAVHEGGAAL